MYRVIMPLMLVLFFTGCTKKKLDRETAAKLLQGRNFGTVQGSFPSTPGFIRFQGNDDAYNALMQLAQAGVISCTGTDTCAPGPNGNGVSGGASMGPFRYTAGSFSLSGIEGVQQSSPTNATVQARLVFQPSPLYSQHKELLDRLQNGRMVGGTGMQVEPALAQQTASRVEQIQFALFDDGWRAQ
ncbi:MAG: hypothetical protein IT165_28125 [Bryobacterales bacterium]|nr:hypothetical protein [Bryobacterales bacterium]